MDKGYNPGGMCSLDENHLNCLFYVFEVRVETGYLHLPSPDIMKNLSLVILPGRPPAFAEIPGKAGGLSWAGAPGAPKLRAGETDASPESPFAGPLFPGRRASWTKEG